MQPVLALLRPSAASWGAIHGSGRWSVSFRAKEDLLFFRIDLGTCQFRRTGAEPLPLAEADCLIVRTSVPFTLASDATSVPIDSWSLVARTRRREMQLGDGSEPSALIRGGRIAFEASDHDPLMRLLPPIVHIPRDGLRSERVRNLLAMMEVESAAPDAWSASVGPRLLELLLIECFREENGRAESDAPNLFAGLLDPVVSRALTAMHRDVARPWTLKVLAASCGRSRSAFSQRFQALLGLAPIAYLQRLRMAVAKDELRQGRRSVAEIALVVGFQSSNAFSSAFRHAVGCSPTAYAARWTNLDDIPREPEDRA